MNKKDASSIELIDADSNDSDKVHTQLQEHVYKIPDQSRIFLLGASMSRLV